MKIALLQLYSNGDCLFATIIARQIKNDYPTSKLTWIVSKSCRGMLEGNTDIDVIEEVDLKGKNGIEVWHTEYARLQQRKLRGEFDQVVSSQIIGDNESYYTGTIRSTILNSYQKKITVGYKPYIFLSEVEIEEVDAFVKANKLDSYHHKVLFECAPVSGQAPINPAIATQLCEELLKEIPNTCFILTSGEKINSTNEAIIDASSLTVRQNAELINRCTHLIGCSSGISWLATSTWCKTIPMLQLMNPKAFYFNSMIRDSIYLNLDSKHIIETRYSGNEDFLKQLIRNFIEDFEFTKQKYHQVLNDESTTVYSIARKFLIKRKWKRAFEVVRNSYFLNKLNWRWYVKIVKLLVLTPIFVFISEK